MTDQELNYYTMARQTERQLAASRPTWEAEAPRLLPDFEQLTAQLAAFDQVAGQRQGLSSQGYTDAKDAAEATAVAAALRVIKGLRAVQLDHPRPELAAVAVLTKSGLDKLRDSALADTLDAVRAAAQPLAAELAPERVTAQHLAELDTAAAAYRPLIGTARGQQIAGSTLRTTAKKLVTELRATLDRLDTRLDTLEDDFPELVAAYRQARRQVAAGRGGAAAPAEAGG
ncbi:hypothetical protein [uncultured Hymenobacter sp.]|uniref:hypothetical protein n=1 Tax=uncultured Hymenobacter sp. TaxID=170016 RepID=UPI0035CAC783